MFERQQGTGAESHIRVRRPVVAGWWQGTGRTGLTEVAAPKSEVRLALALKGIGRSRLGECQGAALDLRNT